MTMAPLRCKVSGKVEAYCLQMIHLWFYSAVPTLALQVSSIREENLRALAAVL